MKKPSKPSAKRPPKAAAKSRATRPELPEIGTRLPHKLDEAIPYLLARAGERMGGTFGKELRPFKLTLNEWRVCVALHFEAHQRLSDLVGHTSTDASTLSRIVDGLIKRGLAQRDRSTEDARAIAVSLTPAGVVLTEKIIPIAQLYERVGLSGISGEEAALLRNLLRRLYDNIGILARS